MGLDLMAQALAEEKRKKDLFGGVGMIGGAPMVAQIGQIYLDLELKRPLRVTGGRCQRWSGMGYVYHYPVEDILTGQTHYFPRKAMSEEPLNEMEVIAWAAS